MPTDADAPSPSRNPWRSRGYLPHFDRPGTVQSLTIRLVDSMPQSVLDSWELELAHFPKAQSDLTRRKRMEDYLDAGHGACWLRRGDIAELVETSLLHFDGERYHIIAWCVMPNHVHFLIETMVGWSLSEVLYSIKSYTAKQANQRLGRGGPFWQREYHDRYMRDQAHMNAVVRYIHENPVKAGLVSKADDWPWSSAGSSFRSAAVPGG